LTDKTQKPSGSSSTGLYKWTCQLYWDCQGTGMYQPI